MLKLTFSNVNCLPCLTHTSLTISFLGHRQTVQTQVRRRRMRRLIRVFTICGNVYLKYSKNEKDTPKIGNGLVQLIRMDVSSRQIWVNFIFSLVCNQDAEAVAKEDVQRVLGATEEYKRRWNSTWEEQERRLRQNLQICQFNFDLRQVSNMSEIGDLSGER